jgi:hypothetical protein
MQVAWPHTQLSTISVEPGSPAFLHAARLFPLIGLPNKLCFKTPRRQLHAGTSEPIMRLMTKSTTQAFMQLSPWAREE